MLLATRLSSSRQPTLSAFAASLHSAIASFRFSRNTSTGCQCFCSPAGRCGLRDCHAFCINAWYPNAKAIAYTWPTHKGKKSRQPLCSSAPFRAFVESKNTKALHSTPHIAIPRCSFLTAFRSGTLAPLAGRLAKLVCRAATRSVTLRSLHPPVSRFLVFLRSRTKLNPTVNHCHRYEL